MEVTGEDIRLKQGDLGTDTFQTLVLRLWHKCGLGKGVICVFHC